MGLPVASRCSQCHWSLRSRKKNHSDVVIRPRLASVLFCDCQESLRAPRADVNRVQAKWTACSEYSVNGYRTRDWVHFSEPFYFYTKNEAGNACHQKVTSFDSRLTGVRMPAEFASLLRDSKRTTWRQLCRHTETGM